MGASGSVLGRGLVAQRRVAVPVVVVVFEVGDDHAASSRVGQQLRFRHSSRSWLLNDSMNPLFHGVPGGMYEMPTDPERLEGLGDELRAVVHALLTTPEN